MNLLYYNCDSSQEDDSTVKLILFKRTFAEKD